MSTADAQVPGATMTGTAERERRFADCFDRHYPRVLAYGLRRLPDRAAAEDAAAEAFLIAWRRLDDAPADLLPWLLAITRNVIRNETRSARRRTRLAERVATDRAVTDPPRPGPVPDGGGEAPAATAAVRAALQRLSERDREILMLTSWDGLDTTRAAAVLGCSRATFAVRLHRARTRLAQALSAPAFPPMPEEPR